VKRARGFIVTGVVALAIVLLAAVLAGCGSDEKLYTDSTHGYSFTYPNGWKVQEGTSDVTAGGQSTGNVGVYDTNGTKVGNTYVDLAMVMVYKLSFTVDDPWSSDIKTELEGVLTALENQTTDVQVEKALSQTTTAGLKGYSITYTFTKDGTAMRSTLYFLFDGTMEYELTEQAAVSAWETTKPALDGIVSSFKPGRAK
jgi:uncharacterized protein YndB with AHSA1/START domain